MNISKEQFTKLAKEHLIALESYKMDKNGNKPIEIFGIEKLYEAINYTHFCETLKAVDTPTFKQWLKLKKIPKVDNLYYYKGTHYFSIEINNIYKEWCRLHL